MLEVTFRVVRFCMLPLCLLKVVYFVSFFIALSLQYISVMYSYPNRIPLPVKEINRINKLMNNIKFDAMYGFWPYQNIEQGAKELLHSSLERYM